MGKTVFVCPQGCDGEYLTRSGFAVTCKCCGRLAKRVECVVRFGDYVPVKPQRKLCTVYKSYQVRCFA